LIFSLDSREVLTMFLVVILLDSLIFIYGFHIAFAQQRSQTLSSPQLSVVNAITSYSNASHATAIILHVNKTARQSAFISPIDEVSAHYPTPQEKGKLDKIVNQTLSMLQPIGRAINESHSCILEAVICGSGNMTNGITFRL
jgi:hypothetical protein